MVLTVLWVIFIADAILLVLIVLLQSGRGGGLSGMLGGGGAQAALGPKSGLPKITGGMAAVFFVAAVLIGLMSRERAALRDVKTGETGKKAATSTAGGTAEQEPDTEARPAPPGTSAAPPGTAAAPRTATPARAGTDTPARAAGRERLKTIDAFWQQAARELDGDDLC